MRTLQLGLMTAVLCLAAGEARAQGNGAGLDGIGTAYLVGAIGVSVFASSVVTGVGSFHEGRLRTLGWATWSSAVLGLGALGTGIGMLGWGAKELRYSGGTGLLMAGTLIIGQGLWNIGTAVFSFVRRGQAEPSPAPSVVPVVLSGRSLGGQAWSGLGVAVAL